MATIALAAESLPEPLREAVQQHWQAFLDTACERGIEVPDEPDFLRSLGQVWASSLFVSRTCVRDPGLLRGLLDSGDLSSVYTPVHYRQALEARVHNVSSEPQLMEEIRRFRQREMVRIAWRDLARWAALEEITTDLSRLAEACLECALGWLYTWQCQHMGTPTSPDGQPQHLVVIGMGKLGAGELNFSSDIDLIFAYPQDGETQGGRTVMHNEQFFVRLGQRLIHVLNQPTADGFVFRVDMRLRPFGARGPLAVSFAGLEEYYQRQGRDWERYAWVKASVVAGDQEAGNQLVQALRPFVYRRYLDFGAFDALRDMKRLIVRELQRRGLEDNIKLGAGGIREVEFIGQTFQLIRGGREPDLQDPRILVILERLGEKSYLPQYAVEELKQAYSFLRQVEHRLQAYADEQTQTLPLDPKHRLALALSMGFHDWTAFERALRIHMSRVHGHFEQLVTAPQTEHAGEEPGDIPELSAVWEGTVDDGPALAALQAAGFEAGEQALEQVIRLRKGYTYRALSKQGQKRMNTLMPLLLSAVGKTDQPGVTLQRISHLVETIAQRTAYLSLLVENPLALSQLVKLCAASPWIASLLARHPILLDELLDPRSLYRVLGRADLERELQEAKLHLADGDEEQKMELLRLAKQTNVLRVAAADIFEVVPLMVVSDHLTEIAEVMLREVMEVEWRRLVKRHGRPPCGESASSTPGFAIIAYGKLGGIEFGYGSDLDVVFLHDNHCGTQLTDGAKPLEGPVFFARLVQRLIHMLATHTGAGVLYEVDLRLRPSGTSGLLVSSLEAFAEYQRHRAWTWEHQALVRARAIAGDRGIMRTFQVIRAETLTQPRDPAVLQQAVREMREKMRTELDKSKPGQFDLKQGRGGITDIEFMVQYSVLRWAYQHTELIDFTDNIRLLGRLGTAGLLAMADVRLLSDAYRHYRATVHRQTLQEQPAVVAQGQFQAEREEVRRLWHQLMEDQPHS